MTDDQAKWLAGLGPTPLQVLLAEVERQALADVRAHWARLFAEAEARFPSEIKTEENPCPNPE